MFEPNKVINIGMSWSKGVGREHWQLYYFLKYCVMIVVFVLSFSMSFCSEFFNNCFKIFLKMFKSTLTKIDLPQIIKSLMISYDYKKKTTTSPLFFGYHCNMRSERNYEPRCWVLVSRGREGRRGQMTVQLFL